MKAIILAAGRGSRMKKLTDERPKCMVELHRKPLLEWQLKALRDAGIDDIAIVTGYKQEMFAQWNLKEFYNPRWAETNMVSSLACAQEWLKAEPCIVSYSDIFYDAAAVRSLMTCNASLAVTYDPQWLKLWVKRFGDPLLDAETFRLNDDGCLTEIGNKPNAVDEVQGQYMGLLRFTPEGWSEVMHIRNRLTSLERDKMHMTGTLQRVIDAGRVPIVGVPYLGEWGEVDNAEDLSLYQNHEIL